MVRTFWITLTAFRAEKEAFESLKKLGITPKGTARIYISSQSKGVAVTENLIITCSVVDSHFLSHKLLHTRNWMARSLANCQAVEQIISVR